MSATSELGPPATGRPTLVLLAHGTRDEQGRTELERLAELVAGLGPEPVVLGFADVCRPTLADVLAETPGPAIVVPAFLAAGYHVRVDVPAALRALDRPDVRLAGWLGSDPALIDVALQRLREAGWPGTADRSDRVVLGAAGSTDPTAVAEVRRAAAALGERIGAPVEVGFVTGAPTVASLVAGEREVSPTNDGIRADQPAAVASWLLTFGMFQRTLLASNANVVAAPLGAHPAVAAVIKDRYLAVADGLPSASGVVPLESRTR